MADNLDILKRAIIDLKNKQRLLDNRFGENSPINNNLLPNMEPGSIVFIAEDVKDILSLIQEKTQREKKEVPFLLFGKTVGQTVFIYHIDAELDILSGVEADHANLMPALEEFIRKSKKDGTDIVVHGHSHPKSINNYHLNFSLGDMISYKNFRFNNEDFRTGKIELCSCLLTGGNYNFLFFDGDDYYKFNDVYVQAKNGDIIEKLPCYNNVNMLQRDYGRD